MAFDTLGICIYCTRVTQAILCETLGGVLRLEVSKDLLEAKIQFPAVERIATPLAPELTTSAATPKSSTEPAAPVAAEDLAPQFEILLDTVWAALQQTIAQQHITYGVRLDEAHTEVAEWLRDGKSSTLLLAQGTPSRYGEDGHVDILYTPPPVTPGISLVISNVVKATPLACLYPPTQGTPGRTITDQPIPTVDGHPATPPHVEGQILTVQEENGAVVFTVSADGILTSLTPARLAVLDRIEVPHDVDPHAGPIEVFGGLTVKGSIASQAPLKVRGDLVVHGNIENTYVEAQGSITVDGGILGAADGVEIRAGGHLRARFAQNAHLSAGGDATLEDSLVNSRLACGGSCEITKKIGAVVTSRIVAGGSAVANTYGSNAELHVEIVAGNNPKVWEKVQHLERQLAYVRRNGKHGRYRNTSRKTPRALLLMQPKRRRIAALMERQLERQYRNIAHDLASTKQLPTICAKKQFHAMTHLQIGYCTLMIRDTERAGCYVPDLVHRMLLRAQ